jgi:hypothetical protein
MGGADWSEEQGSNPPGQTAPAFGLSSFDNREREPARLRSDDAPF